MKVGEEVKITTTRLGKEFEGLVGIIVSDIKGLVVKIYNGIELLLTADEIERKR